MKVLDLHGVRHKEVSDLVENLIHSSKEPIFKIIVGNSNRMLELVSEVLVKHSFKYDYENWSNMGAIVAYKDIE
tara:strand:+ start:225 stop:446 length:222 start_codon:yes stop_codon:yes gene_type:complete